MPEEGWVLKCYSCNKFQVQLKKKAKKWQCKVCGKKQDLMTIFFKGQPKDCRVNVQNLNKAEGEKLEKQQEQSFAEDFADDFPDDFDYDPDEQILQTSQSTYFRDEDEKFNEEAIAEVDKEFRVVEENYSQKNLNSEDYLLEDDNLKKDFTETSYTHHFRNQLLTHQSTNEENFEKSLLDFSSKKQALSNKTDEDSKLQEPKNSIFESNHDLDESLDF